MRIKEALEALKKGKKIRHSSWGKDDFIWFNAKEYETNFYCLMACQFLIDPETLLSEGWYVEGNPDETMDFNKALEFLASGARVKHAMDDEEEFIEMDMASKMLLKRKYEKRSFTIDPVTLFSNEWMISE